MTKTKHNKVGEKRNVILDSNIVQYLGTDGLSERIMECLREVVGAGYDLAISDISFYELLNSAPIEKEVAVIRALTGVKRFFVKKSVLIAAAHMGCMYSADKVHPEQIDVGDKIIAATAVVTNSVVFTANARDFPSPFFRELARKTLQYERKGQPVFLSAVFLEPDIGVITPRHNLRLKEYEMKHTAEVHKSLKKGE
jgi:predicted nucleic acid-binding protein